MSPKQLEEAAETAQEVAGGSSLTPRQKKALGSAVSAFNVYEKSREAMASIAKSIVDLRLTFTYHSPRGGRTRPDYRGETPQYRGAIAQLYQTAIPDEDERRAFKVAIRYWVAKEFAMRVEQGPLKKSQLVAAGIMKSSRAPKAMREPRRARTNANGETGITYRGAKLSPAEVLVAAEEMLEEHAPDGLIGPVIGLQSIARSLGPVVAALRDPKVRDRLPGRALHQAGENVLELALDAAKLAGVEIEEAVANHVASLEEVAA